MVHIAHHFQFSYRAFALAASILIIFISSASAFHISKRQSVNTFQLNALSRRQYLLSSAAAVTLIPTRSSQALDLIYQGVYTDPKRFKGYKVLFGDESKAILLFQDDPSDEVHEIPVQITSVDGSIQFSFDYSAIDQPTKIGTLTKDREDIPLLIFADDTWKKRETGPIGVYYSDSLKPSNRIVIRQVKGAEWAVDIIDNLTRSVAQYSAKAGNPIVFRMPDGEVNGVFSMKDKTIRFDDGSVWKKF